MRIAAFSSIVCAMSLAVASSAQAALIVEYTFNGTTAPTTEHDNILASDFMLGSGLESLGYDAATGTRLQAGTASTDVNDFNTAITANDFFEFSVMVDPNHTLSLTDLQITTRAGHNGVDNLQVRIYNSGLAGGFVDTTTMSISDTLAMLTLPIGATSLTGLTTFQIAGWGQTSITHNRTWQIDTVTLNGTAAPEPSALLLSSVFLPGYFLVRRRKAKAAAAEQATAAA